MFTIIAIYHVLMKHLYEPGIIFIAIRPNKKVFYSNIFFCSYKKVFLPERYSFCSNKKSFLLEQIAIYIYM